MPLATAQVQFSLLSRGPDQMTTQAVCRDLGITLIAYSPLGLGVLPCRDAVCSTCASSCFAGCLVAEPCMCQLTRWSCGFGNMSLHLQMLPDAARKCCAGMLTGKYSPDQLPAGPRGILFRQILPGLQPLLDTMRQIASRRRKTMSQVRELLPAKPNLSRRLLCKP